jgi:aminoglycoside phosphotransferase (APT) family kinase protein
LAVIDWELSTLGHPLCDLAYTCMLYDVMLPKIGGLAGVDFEASGIPSEEQFVARYCDLVGRDGVPDLGYYKAFSLFRLAAIAQGVYKRSIDGNASSPEASMFGAAVPHLAGIACGLVGIR